MCQFFYQKNFRAVLKCHDHEIQHSEMSSLPNTTLCYSHNGHLYLQRLCSDDTHLSLGVAEDDGLGDGEGVVEVTQRVKLPLLTLHRHKELLDALQGQLITATCTSQYRQPPHSTDNHLTVQATTSQYRQPPHSTDNHLTVHATPHSTGNHLTVQATTSQYRQPPHSTGNHLTVQATTSQYTTTSKYRQPPDSTGNHLTVQTTTSQYRQPPHSTGNHLTVQATT